MKTVSVPWTEHDTLCIIMRGIQGSGKSHWIEANFPAHDYPDREICSADLYHYNDAGVYDYNPNMADTYHLYCYKKFLRCGQSGIQPLIVDNTNLTISQIAPYYQLARAMGYTPWIVQMVCDPGKAARRNQHGLTLDQVLEAHNRIESLPPWYNVYYVSSVFSEDHK